MEHQIIIIVFVILLSMFMHDYLNKPVFMLCDTEKCPYCYGTDFCENIQMNNVVLTHSNLHDFFSNYLSVKNVYKGVFKNESVVLKKLGHNWELDELDDLICVQNDLNKNCVLSEIIDVQNYEEKIVTFLNRDSSKEIGSFKCCNVETSRLFLERLITLNNIVARENYLKNVWTTLQMNVEPLVLKLFNNNENFPIPHLYGSCGRLIVQKNAGDNLNSIYSNEWIQRAYVALQIVKAAKAFTQAHEEFRFYLTDIDPDNIVVDENLKVTFIDLENIILINKGFKGVVDRHQSDNILSLENENIYSYEEHVLCNSTISDHNYYAVCKLILSENSPYPMMYKGLLHSPPNFVRTKHNFLFELIKVCENPTVDMDRFKAIERITSTLEEILEEHQFEL